MWNWMPDKARMSKLSTGDKRASYMPSLCVGIRDYKNAKEEDLIRYKWWTHSDWIFPNIQASNKENEL
jgi:hypothetical protein